MASPSSPPLNLKTDSVLVQGVRVHWSEVAGPAESMLPPLVMLHGLHDSHRTWARVLPLLARTRRVMMPDLPGHGLSERPDASYDLTWYAKIMAGWLEALALAEVDLSGHSLGGGVAQMLLLECPERIRRLALIASGGLGREIALVLRLASLPLVIEHCGQPFMGLGTRLALWCARDGRSPEDITALAGMNAQPGSARAFARTVQQIMSWRGQKHTLHDRLHEIPRLPPVRLFWGECDQIIPVKHGQMLREAFAGVDLHVFAGCGHFPHYEQPELFAAALADFFSDPSVEAPVGRGFPELHGVRADAAATPVEAWLARQAQSIGRWVRTKETG